MKREVLAVGVASLAATGLLALAPGRVAELIEAVHGLGPWAPPACAGLVILAGLACVPRWLYTAATGFACGAAWGIPVVLVSAASGASIAFAIGRRLGRAWVERRAGTSVRAAAVDDAVAEGGFAIVALVRISPVIPCSVMSYVFGASRIPFRTFLAATVVGMIPGTVLYVLLGAAAKDLAEMLVRGAWTPWAIAYAAVGAAVTVLAVAWMFWATRSCLQNKLDMNAKLR